MTDLQPKRETESHENPLETVFHNKSLPMSRLNLIGAKLTVTRNPLHQTWLVVPMLCSSEMRPYSLTGVRPLEARGSDLTG